MHKVTLYLVAKSQEIAASFRCFKTMQLEEAWEFYRKHEGDFKIFSYEMVVDTVDVDYVVS